ncbi:MAG: ABC transporter permease [Bryobacteraceae bacterium]
MRRWLNLTPSLATIASGGHTIPFMGYTEQRPSSELYTLRRSTRDQAFRLPFRGADVMPGYFATLGVPLLAGRDFNENDTIGAQPVVVISQRTAETMFPGELAVGQKLRFGINQSYDPWSTVIGVVGNVRFNAGERVPGHEVYWPYRQYPGPGMRYLIRTSADPANLLPRLKQIIRLGYSWPSSQAHTWELSCLTFRARIPPHLPAWRAFCYSWLSLPVRSPRCAQRGLTR